MKTSRFRIASLLTCGLALGAFPAFAGDSKAHDKFQSMDTNNDGRVSREEHTAGAKQMFSTMDANRDGTVTADEMDAAHRDKPNKPMSAERSADMIRLLDQNADGQLTAAEHDASCTTQFDKMDANADGSLSKDEMAAGHKKMKDKNHSD